MKLLILLVGLFVMTGTASAEKKYGVTLPDTQTYANKRLVLNGMGLREATILDIDVYVAGLYLEAPSSIAMQIIHANEAKLLVLRFVRDVDHDDIVKAWNEGFAKNAIVPVARIKPLIAQLNSWMPAFEKGDTLMFGYAPGQGLTVDINGVRKGVLRDDDFARSLFAIWLGPKPPNAGLKRGLLGNHPVRR